MCISVANFSGHISIPFLSINCAIGPLLAESSLFEGLRTSMNSSELFCDTGRLSSLSSTSTAVGTNVTSGNSLDSSSCDAVRIPESTSVHADSWRRLKYFPSVNGDISSGGRRSARAFDARLYSSLPISGVKSLKSTLTA
jgi:hypothetical protein